MIARGALLICLMGLLAGCQSSPLVGTKWNIVELHGPDAAHYPEFRKMVFEFQRNGRLVTTTTLADGRVEVIDNERYAIDALDNVITISTPDSEIIAMYRLDGEQLRVHSERFIVLADPYREP